MLGPRFVLVGRHMKAAPLLFVSTVPVRHLHWGCRDLALHMPAPIPYAALREFSAPRHYPLACQAWRRVVAASPLLPNPQVTAALGHRGLGALRPTFALVWRYM